VVSVVRFKSLSMSVMAVSLVVLPLPSAPVLLNLLVDQGDRDIVNHHIFALGVLSTAQHEWLRYWRLRFGEGGGIDLNWLALGSGDLEGLWCFRVRRVARGADGDWSGTGYASHDSWLGSRGYRWPRHDVWTAGHGEVLEERLEGVTQSVGIELRNARFWLLAVLVVSVASVLTVTVTVLLLIFLAIQERAHIRF